MIPASSMTGSAPPRAASAASGAPDWLRWTPAWRRSRSRLKPESRTWQPKARTCRDQEDTPRNLQPARQAGDLTAIGRSEPKVGDQTIDDHVAAQRGDIDLSSAGRRGAPRRPPREARDPRDEVVAADDGAHRAMSELVARGVVLAEHDRRLRRRHLVVVGRPAPKRRPSQHLDAVGMGQ